MLNDLFTSGGMQGAGNHLAYYLRHGFWGDYGRYWWAACQQCLLEKAPSSYLLECSFLHHNQFYRFDQYLSIVPGKCLIKLIATVV